MTKRISAPKRTAGAIAERSEGGAAAFLPPRLTLPALRTASKGCRGCPLWRVGTQTVFGEGPRRATIMLVGEQPGDKEDLAGHPFVGPSGVLLDSVLERAGIARDDAYVTNAVKHFKWVAGGGKRRLHKTPSAGEVRACHPWLDAELAVVKPRVVVALGATAAKSLFGNAVKVTVDRGKALATDAAETGFVTVHPSSVLRAPSSAERKEAEAAMVKDLRAVARWLAKHASG